MGKKQWRFWKMTCVGNGRGEGRWNPVWGRRCVCCWMVYPEWGLTDDCTTDTSREGFRTWPTCGQASAFVASAGGQAPCLLRELWSQESLGWVRGWEGGFKAGGESKKWNTHNEKQWILGPENVDFKDMSRSWAQQLCFPCGVPCKGPGEWN